MQKFMNGTAAGSKKELKSEDASPLKFRSEDEDDFNSSFQNNEQPISPSQKKNTPINSTLQLSKFRSPQGTVLGNNIKRFHMDNVLLSRSKMPAPGQYLTSPKLKVQKKKKKKNESESEISETASEILAKKVAAAM